MVECHNMTVAELADFLRSRRERLTPKSVGLAPGHRRRTPGLRREEVAELKTTFASRYTQVVSLQEALQLSHIAVYGKRATGEKYLINPNKG